MKIDLEDIYQRKSDLDSAIRQLKTGIESARAYLQKLAASEALDGQVKQAINAKINHHQIPLMTNYLQGLDILSNDFSSLITTFKSTVGETDNTAVIDTEALHNLKLPFQGLEQGFSTIRQDTARIYSDISDILALENPSTTKLTESFHTAKHVLEETEAKMDAFNSLNTKSAFEDVLQEQNSELSALNGIKGPAVNKQETFIKIKTFLRLSRKTTPSTTQSPTAISLSKPCPKNWHSLNIVGKYRSRI